jgi:hypothetical protein
VAIVFIFEPKSMNRGQYHRLLAKLEEAGIRDQPGRSVHVCFGSGDKLRIFDVWDSTEALTASFADGVLPILQEVGIEALPPQIFPVERIIS